MSTFSVSAQAVLLSKTVIAKLSVLVLTLGLVFTATLNGQTFTTITEGDIVNDGAETPGCAWGDLDNDGDLDIFLPGGGVGGDLDNYLYSNNGDGTFTKISAGVVVTDGGASASGSWADFDNDGDLDLFVANLQSSQNNFLYANNGDGSFTKITDGDIVNEGNNSFTSSWGDFNNDGALDLFVANGATSFPQKNLLYQNNGNGTFTKVGESSIVNDSGNFGSSSWADYDNDGDLDLFVAQVGNRRNFFYANNGDGSFTKITEGDIVNDLLDTRSVSWGDFDNDGDLDLFAAEQNFPNSQNNSLYQNNGDGTFTKITTGAIVTNRGYSNGSSWGDYENDGDLDLFVANAGANFLYANNNDGTFTRITSGEIVNDAAVSVGCAWGDYDNDGDLDMFVGNADGNNFLFVNDGNTNHWVNINCVGLATPTPQIGTKVRVKTTTNGSSVWQMREISGQTGNGSQNSLRVHFGLGDATSIDSVQIEWPSGNRDVYSNVSANTFYKAVEGAGLNLLPTSVENTEPKVPQQFELSPNFPNPFNPATTIKYSLPTPGRVTLKVYNLLGKEVTTLVDNEPKQAGDHVAVWNGRSAAGNVVASGLYLVRMQAANFIQTRKMVLVQ